MCSRQSVKLHPDQAAGPHNAVNLAQVFEDDVAAGDVLEDRVGIHEIERLVFKSGKARAVRDAQMGVRDAAQLVASERDHFVGDVDAVDLDEVTAHRPHQTAQSASDFECAPVAALRGWNAA